MATGTRKIKDYRVSAMVSPKKIEKVIAAGECVEISITVIRFDGHAKMVNMEIFPQFEFQHRESHVITGLIKEIDGEKVESQSFSILRNSETVPGYTIRVSKKVREIIDSKVSSPTT